MHRFRSIHNPASASRPIARHLFRRLARAPPWFFLAVLFGLAAFLALLSLALPSVFYDGFVGPYLWNPIIHDQGYNPVNTTALLVVLVLLLAWVYRLLQTYGERFHPALLFAPLPVFLWGPILRVLEDADLFAPFASDIAAVRPDLPLRSSCVPEVGGSILDQCFGTLFITPLNFVWIMMLEVGLALLANQARRVANQFGLKAGLRYYGLTLVAAFALYLAWWASEPTYLRFLAHPVVFLSGLVIGYVVVFRHTTKHQAFDWRWGLFGYLLVPLPWTLYYVLVWLTKGNNDWRPAGATQGWILVVFLVFPTILAIAMAWKARYLAGQVRKPKRAKKPRSPAILLGYLLLIEASALFGSLLSVRDFAEGKVDLRTFKPVAYTAAEVLVGPLAVAIGIWVAWRAARNTTGTHKSMAVFAGFQNQLLLWSQVGDAFMTSLALDVYHAAEKHVVPSSLIYWVAGLDLPQPLAMYPAAVVMIPYKVLFSLVFIWILDVRVRPHFPGRALFFMLVKWAVIVVGAVPGARDALRLAMGV